MEGELARFGWDDAKSAACLADRGFDFEFAARIFSGAVFERPDDRRDHGEVRIQAIGRIEGRLFVVVYTQRGEVRRIISARRAHQKELDRWPR